MSQTQLYIRRYYRRGDKLNLFIINNLLNAVSRRWKGARLLKFEGFITIINARPYQAYDVVWEYIEPLIKLQNFKSDDPTATDYSRLNRIRNFLYDNMTILDRLFFLYLRLTSSSCIIAQPQKENSNG
jgi:hypothetical protein